MKQKIFPALFVLLCFYSLQSNGQTPVSFGVTGGRSLNWVKAPILNTVETQTAIGGYAYVAPMVYYRMEDNISFSLETQFGIGELEPNKVTLIGIGRTSTVLKSTVMLRANFFSAANTGDEDGITVGTCNLWFTDSFDCLNLGFWGGIGREWTSKLRFESEEMESFVSYPIELGMTFNFFHPNTAIGIFGRMDVFSRTTSSNSFGFAITWNFPNGI
ncbi:MAG: hypothetical protein ACPG19_02040 [Saprospiraceae bacterium]